MPQASHSPRLLSHHPYCALSGVGGSMRCCGVLTTAQRYLVALHEANSSAVRLSACSFVRLRLLGKAGKREGGACCNKRAGRQHTWFNLPKFSRGSPLSTTEMKQKNELANFGFSTVDSSWNSAYHISETISLCAIAWGEPSAVRSLSGLVSHPEQIHTVLIATVRLDTRVAPPCLLSIGLAKFRRGSTSA